MLTHMKWQTGGPVPRIFNITVNGVFLSSRTIPELFRQFSTHHDRNDLRLPIGWEDLVWSALAVAYPKHVKRLPGESGLRMVSVPAALNFIRFLAKRISDRSLVSPEAARRRAAVCSACPMAGPVAGCSVCKDALGLTVRPPEKVEVAEGCSACGCYLPLKIWVPRDQLGDAGAFPFDPGCWMLSPDPDLVQEMSPEEPVAPSPFPGQAPPASG